MFGWQRDRRPSKPDPRLAGARRRMYENAEDIRNAADYGLFLRDEHEEIGHPVPVRGCRFCERSA